MILWFNCPCSGRFGTRQAPLTTRLKKILSDYPPGAQILKVGLHYSDLLHGTQLVSSTHHAVLVWIALINIRHSIWYRS